MNEKSSATSNHPSSAEIFQLLIEGVVDYAIYLLSPEGKVSSWNIGAQRLKGYAADEIIGQHFSTFYTNEDRASGRPDRALTSALSEGSFKSEGWRIRKDGSRFWASVTITPVYDANRSLLGFSKITRDLDDRRHAEEALQASEERFRLLVEGVVDYAIYMLTPTGEITNWNTGAERIKGYAREEVIGTNFSRFYTEEDRNLGKPDQALAIARETGRVAQEGWRVRKDGTMFWAEVVIDALYDNAGAFMGFAKITRDATEKKLALDEKLRTGESQLQLKTEQYEHLMRLFEQAPGFVCFFRGPTHIYELTNEAHSQLVYHKDIIGKPIREAFPELADQGFYELLDKVYQTGEPFRGRAWPLKVAPDQDHLEGQPRYIDFVYQPVVGADGTIIGIFSQGNDVTERVIAEEALKKKQDELERVIAERTSALEQVSEALAQARQLRGDIRHLLRLFDHAPGFVCYLSGPDHVFEMRNKAHAQYVGYRDVVGKPVREALPELAGQGYYELLDEVFSTGVPFIGQGLAAQIQDGPNGSLRMTYVDFVYHPVTDDSGKVMGIFCSGHDVTQQKIAQDELQRYQDGLENLVAERTRTLAETQAALQRSQRLESLGKLTGGVAHDFNNILQVIGGNVQLLQGYLSGNEMATNRLEYALSAVDRGAKLSSHLLAFARRQPLVPVVMSPGRVIKNMDEMLHRTLGESIDIETVVGGGLWNTLIDPNQLENVVLNLCINARDAMTNGGKLTIEIGNSMLNDEYALKDDVPAGQYVMLAVSDTGTGMAPEVLTQACEPFFTTKPEGEGTGLGLSMAYGFVRQSGGHFKIYSEVGHGTTVKMYFPRSYEEEMEFVPLPTGPIVGGSETILVVEDDPAVQATVVEMLTSLGYKVLKADNAGSALIILRSGLPIDLLFTDVVMPGPLRSPELAKKAKALIPSIEILFTSGYTQNAIVHGGRLDPGVQLLSKPYRQEQLARKIRHMLGNRKQLEIAKDPAKLRLVPSVDPSVSPAEALRVLVVEDVEDLLMLACEFVSILGHKADGALSAEEALECLKRGEYDLLVTDIGLPGMNGRELAQMAKTMYPHIKIVYASGYGDAGEGDAFASVILSKPYELNQLTAALNKARALRD